MRVLLSAYGPRGDVEQVAGHAVRLRALGADGNRAAELVAAPAEGCDALVATRVTPAGVWL